MQSTSSTKLVHASTECASGSRSPQTSYPSSTRSHRVSLGHVYVFCCVLVSVVMCAAFGAVPFADIQWQQFDDMAASRTQFTGRKKPVNKLFFLPVPFTFILNHLPKSPHADIENYTSETMIARHAPHVQILNSDHVKLSHEIGGKLVKSVGTTLSNMLCRRAIFTRCLCHRPLPFLRRARTRCNQASLERLPPR